MSQDYGSLALNASLENKNSTADAALKDWTVMVYLAADNNLSENMAYSLESLGRLSASLSDEEKSRVNLLAFYEGSSLTAPRMYLDYSGPDAGNGPFKQPVTQEFQHQREGSQQDPADALLNFIRWCTSADGGRRRKARNYALILSGHSMGFHGPTFLRADTTGRHFTLGGMRKALEQANQMYLNDSEDGRIAILGFDSCLMSMLEVGHEFKDVARTLVASEGALPNSGWGYAPMLSNFVDCLLKSTRHAAPETPSASVRNAAASLVRSFTTFYSGIAIGGGSIDISAWDLDLVEPLTLAMNRLGAVLDRVLAAPETRAFYELKKVLLQSHYNSQTYLADQYVDIKDFCLRMIEECERVDRGLGRSVFNAIARACSDVVDAVDACVLKCGFSGDAYQFSNGISVFFPWSSLAFALTDVQYRSTRFVAGNGSKPCDEPTGPGKDWYLFLLNYVGRVTVRKARTAAKNRSAEIGGYGTIVSSQSIGGQPAVAGTKGESGDPGSLGGGVSPSGTPTPRLKNMPPLVKNMPPLVKNMPPLVKNMPPLVKNMPPLVKGASEMGSYFTCFSRFKNYELGWDISGFADDEVDE